MKTANKGAAKKKKTVQRADEVNEEVDARDSQRRNAFEYARVHGHAEIMKALLAAKAVWKDTWQEMQCLVCVSYSEKEEEHKIDGGSLVLKQPP